MPMTLCAANEPDRYGSAAKPSQLRPLSVTRHAGPTTGPSRTLTPFFLNSSAKAAPLRAVKSLFQLSYQRQRREKVEKKRRRLGKESTHLAPTWMPLGNELTKSVARSPWPASLKHMPGKPSREMLATLPEQPLSTSLAPPVRLTFSSSVIWDTSSLALA